MIEATRLAEPRAYAMIPYMHVADLNRSIAFYELLGFALRDTHEFAGAPVWAHLINDRSHLFLLLADAPIDPQAQAVLFYLWTTDVSALRDHLVAHEIPVGVITHPPYMPAGEVRLEDPDRYVLLIGQVRRGDTPEVSP